MENLSPPETLTPDPPSAESSDLGAETLAPPTENNAVMHTPFAAGDFVWAKGKGPLWWPALVSPEMKKDSVLVSYFGDCDTLAWCEPKQLKPFLKVFEEMSRQSRLSSFARALESCMKEIEGSLGLEMTCHCVPVEARPKTSVVEGGGGGREVPVANLSAREFVDWIGDAARDVFAVNAVGVLQLKSWVFGFGKVGMRGESWEFRRRRGIEDLVDKIDLDALPVEMVGGKEEEEECLIVGVLRRRRRGRSMPKVVNEVDLDVLEVDEEEEVRVEERSLRSKKRKSKEKLEVVKGEEEVGGSSGRRERKKSKYLSPPYTNMREVGKFLATLPKNSEEKTPKKAATFADDHIGEEDDNKSYLLKIERMPAHELFSEFVAAAENPLHLKGNRAAKFIKYFFAIYRKSEFSGGPDIEEYKKQVPESIVKTEDAVDNAGKRERDERNNKYGSAYKETDLDFKKRKSNSKRGADLETKLDSEELKKSRKDGTNRGNGFNSKQKKSDCLEKERPRRKKISKGGTFQRATINLDFHIEDALDEGKEKQKTGNKRNGTSQVAPVDSDHNLANASVEGKEKHKTRSKKKILNDGTIKGAPADLDLHMVDASGECKPVRGRKRGKNDANGEAAVDVDLQIVSSFQKKGRVCKDVALNSQKPVLMNEKKIGGKEDANGKSFENLGVIGDAKSQGGGKSGSKKKGGTGPPKVKAGRRKAKRVVDPIFGRQAALQLTFHSGIALPSIEDLITSYSKYGALIDTGIELFEESNSARVVFAKAADAENAFKDKAGPYGSVATYRLHYLSENIINPSQPNHDLVSTSLQISDVISPSQTSPDLKSAVLKPPLPYIRKSLETMISTLAWSSSPVNIAGSSSDGLKPEARDNLVGEMQGLLQKVDKMLNGPGSSSST